MTDGLSTPPPLRLGPLLGEGARGLWANRRSFVALALIPILWEVGYEILSVGLYGDDPPLYFDSIFMPVLIALVIVFILGMYRAILIGPQVIRRPIHVQLGRREWVSLLYIFMLVILALVILAAVLSPIYLMGDSLEPMPGELDDSDDIPMSGMIFLFTMLALGFSFSWARFSFLFPAIAVDARFGLRRSWADTKGSYLVLVGATFFPLFVTVVIGVGYMELKPFYPAIGIAGLGLVNVILEAVHYYVDAIGVAIVALAYRQRVGLPVQERSA